MVGATDAVGAGVGVGRGVDVTGNGVFSIVIIGFDSIVAVAGDDALHPIKPDMIPVKTIRNQTILPQPNTHKFFTVKIPYCKLNTEH